MSDKIFLKIPFYQYEGGDTIIRHYCASLEEAKKLKEKLTKIDNFNGNWTDARSRFLEIVLTKIGMNNAGHPNGNIRIFKEVEIID